MIKEELSKRYKVIRPKKLVNQDLRNLKKINNLLLKYQKTQDYSVLQEVKNILILTFNLIDFDVVFYTLFRNAFIMNDSYKLLDEVFTEIQLTQL